MRRLALALALPLALYFAAAPLRGAEASAGDLDTVLRSVRAYLADYFARAQSIISDETVTIQAVGSDMMPEQLPVRVLRNELRVSWEPSPDSGVGSATVLRNLLSVNGRPPREKDRDKCFDPLATSPEILGELFPSQEQSMLKYKLVNSRKIRDRAALAIEIRDTETGPLKVSTRGEDDTCVTWSKPGAYWWRISVDAETYSILRLEEFSTGPLDVELPANRKLGLVARSIVMERTSSTTDYRMIRFSDPDELVMLPVSRQSVQMLRGVSGQNMRLSYSYRNYRRFMTGIRIVQ